MSVTRFYQTLEEARFKKWIAESPKKEIDSRTLIANSYREYTKDHIRISFHQISDFRGIPFPQHLKSLKIMGLNFLDFRGVRLPPNLEILDLSNSCISTIEDIAMPQSLKRINLDNTSISSLPKRIATLSMDCIIQIRNCPINQKNLSAFFNQRTQARHQNCMLGPQLILTENNFLKTSDETP